MSEQDLERRRQRMADMVRTREENAKPETLFSLGNLSRRLADELALSESTARSYLRDAISAGSLIEVKHALRHLIFPAEDGQPTPERFAQGNVARGVFYMTEERQVGPAMKQISFVFTPERLAQVLRKAREADEAEAAARKQREEQYQQVIAAEEAAEAKVFAAHYPELARLLGVLRERVYAPDAHGLGVRAYPPDGGGRGVVKIEVRGAGLAELEVILRDGLGKGESHA